MSGPYPFPNLDPVALEIGPFVIRWYALAFIGGLLVGWGYILYLLRREPKVMTRADVSDFFTWTILGVVIGGRLGYVGFYMPGFYLQNPLNIMRLWDGGMSFHGGLIGVVLAIVIFAYRRQLPILSVADLVACAAPIGLFLGRVANFVNGELYGRTADVPWAIIFPGGGPEGRHPSQLYEAALEGILLFALLFGLARLTGARERPGLLVGVFLLGYGAARTAIEFFREPDAHLGFVVAETTMGQLLSAPLWIAGIFLVVRATLRPIQHA